MRCEIDENVDGQVVLVHLETGAKKFIHESELLSDIAGGRVDLPAWFASGDDPVIAAATADERALIRDLPVGLASPATLRTLLSKLRWIRALQHRGVTYVSDLDYLELEMRHVAPKLRGEIQFRPSTIQAAWRAMANAGGDPRSLVPDFSSRGGAGQLRTCPIGENFLEECLAAAKAEKAGKLKITDIFDSTLKAVRLWNHAHPDTPATAPSMQTASRRFHRTFKSYEIAVRNQNKTYADRYFKEATARIRGEEALEVAQFDDTDGEVFLIDDQTGLPWGRANITCGIDEATGEILGFELSERTRSVWSAISSLLHAVAPKDMSEPMYSECEHPWKSYGVSAQTIMDNALFNHVNEVEAAIVSVGSIPSWSKPKEPTGKSQIEHLNHIIKTEFTPNLPGWRGPKRERDGLKDGPSSAVLSLNAYRRAFAAWATDEYPHKVRDGGLTPHQKWDQHFRFIKPLLPPNPASIKLLCTYREELTFRNTGGLLRLGLRYQSAQLGELRRRIGAKAKVTIRIHPYDLSKMYVYDPIAKLFICIPCIEHIDYLPGLTNWQQQLILKYCREQKLKNPTLIDMVWAREKIRALVEQQRVSKKLLDRRAAQRTGSMPSGRVPKPAASTSPAVATALEASVDALGDVDLDFEDAGWAVPVNQFQ